MAMQELELVEALAGQGIRVTRQRLALGELLFKGGNRHVTVEQLHQEASDLGISVSLATVYNTLNLFVDAGLVRELRLSAVGACFDTNTDPHLHISTDSGKLYDAPLQIRDGAIILPDLPEGHSLADVDVFLQIRKDAG
jgi:Fur family transcriptional regulator, iron response regulator